MNMKVNELTEEEKRARIIKVLKVAGVFEILTGAVMAIFLLEYTGDPILGGIGLLLSLSGFMLYVMARLRERRGK